MKKLKINLGGRKISPPFFKLLLTMKLTFIMLLGTTLALLADDSYSQATKLSLKLEDEPVKEILSDIEEQSEFFFMYNSKLIDVDRLVSVNIKEKNINEVLTSIFSGTDVRFITNDRIIILTPDLINNSELSFQQIVIKGKVTDTDGNSLPGVNVVEKGTTNGAITNLDGDYSISVSSPEATLSFSYVGFLSEEINIGGQTTIDIVMVEDIQTLDEVVVVGYGVQKRGSVTGSVATINSKEISKIKSANVTNALAGKLPGLRAVQRSGAPGDDAAKIDIRGFGSPLVIVDGIERDFRQIDANDIESISVLKDASAAVYGFKGANGVILITTKKGVVSKPEISYSSYYGFQKITRYPELLDGYEYATLYNEAQQNVGVNAPYSEEDLANFKQGIGTTNWWDEVVRNSAPLQYHHINVSGGTEKVKYYFSFGLTDQEGIYKSNDFNYKKYNIRSNISAEITKGLTVELQLSGLLDNRDKPYEADPLSRSIQMAKPVFPIYANDNELYWQNPGDKGNPVHLSDIDNVGYDKRDRREFTGNVILNWQIPGIEGLSAKALLGYDNRNTFTRRWYRAYNEYSYNASSDEYSITASHSISELTTKSENYFKPTQQYSLNYNNTFGNHDFGGLLLWELYDDRKDWLVGYRQFAVSAIDQINAGDNLNKDNEGNAEESAHQGVVGRLNYAFASKYLAEVSFRYDGSYKFDPDARWGFFPAVSLGWRISEETFFQNALSFINNLKLKATYGKVGDEGDFADFQYLSGYIYPKGSYILGSGGVSNGAVDKGMANTALTWYESTTANVGFEASAWNGKLSTEFDYFIRKRDGLLATRLLTLPTTFGQSLPQENLNSDMTKGFEIVLSHRNKIREFNYSINANFSTTRELDDYVERAAPTNMYDNWRNNKNDRYKSISWGKVALGQFQSYEEILNSPIQDNNGNKSLLPGDIKFKDVNNDGIIDSKDDQPIGNSSTPRMYYGLDLYGDYKGFDLSVFFQGAAGHDVFMANDFMDPFIQQGLGNGITIWMDRWHKEDPSDPSSAWIPGEMPAVRPTGFSANNTQSTWTLLNADYLRLKSIELGYTLPASLTQKIGIEKLRVYINSYNTLTFTSNEGIMKYMDPENDQTSLRYYPQMKTFNVGFNLSF